MSILLTFRGLLGALQQLAAACQAISVSLAAGLDREGSDDDTRQQLEGLLLSRAKWEAEMEALLLRADSSYKSASNAESRTRTMVKAYEKELDPLAEDREEDEGPAVLPDYARPGEVEEVHAMHVGVAPNYKENALRFKFS